MSLLTAITETHDHGTGGLWKEFLEVVLDPAHILAELAFTVVFDGLFVALVWGVVIKRFIIPRLRKQIHADIDREHGLGNHQGS